MNDFSIYFAKFESLSSKALDWFIESWELKGIDKEIALLEQKKANKRAMRYLRKAVKYLNG